FFLSCLVVLTGCLFGNGYAQSDDEFTTEKQHLLQVYGDSSVDEATRFRSVDNLVKFYENYKGSVILPYDFKNRADDLIRRYKEEKANAVRVDGVPAQGGFWLPLVKLLLIQLGVELASAGIKRATES
ncbi:hypothetical protein KR084_004278, partial [Drosophila pseudotakahashii]